MNEIPLVVASAHTREDVETCLLDMRARDAIIGGVSQDYRVEQDGRVWVVRAYPPFFRK